ncbi:MAG: gas vesicle protein [Planctomycetia bacterium]|nr:gas vesicle protein [Planctomycetia bacterium]
MEDDYPLTTTDQDSLVELLDRVGDVVISVADIELIFVRLQLLVSSVDTAQKAGWGPVPQRKTDLPRKTA